MDVFIVLAHKGELYKLDQSVRSWMLLPDPSGPASFYMNAKQKAAADNSTVLWEY